MTASSTWVLVVAEGHVALVVAWGVEACWSTDWEPMVWRTKQQGTMLAAVVAGEEALGPTW